MDPRRSYWTDFRGIFILATPVKTRQEGRNLVEIGEKCRCTLGEDLNTVYCCRQTKFVARTLLCNTEYFYVLLTVTSCSAIRTERIAVSIANSGYANAPQFEAILWFFFNFNVSPCIFQFNN